MANTTNFGWETPDDTDLVKDGAAAIRTLGSAIDTSLVDLKGGTTGQILSKTSNTDMDFTWITNDIGDITAVTAGTGITGGGTSGAVTITNDMATTITASGDIVVGTGNATYDNLPIGTTGQVLTADTTVSPYKVKWATPSSGGMTSLATGSLSGSTVSISGISGDYIHLELVLTDLYPSVDANLTATLNNDSGSKYVWGSSFNNSGNSFGTVMRLTAPADNSDRNNYVNIQIPNYTNSLRKIIASRFIVGNDVTATDVNYGQYWGGADITAAITRIDLSWTNSATFSGGTYTLYGVK